MSYYDHAILMHLKQGPWDPDPLSKHRHHLIAYHKHARSKRRSRAAISVVVAAVGLLALGVTGLVA